MSQRQNNYVKVSVVIPAYNEESYIGACLESLMRQKEPADEIIVVDNNCTDNTIAVAKEFPVKIVTEKKQGMIFSRNKGFDEAQFEIIARTDADTRVPPDWIKRIKNKFKRDNELIAIGGPAHYYGLPSVVQVKEWPTNVFFKSLEQVLQHDCLFGPNMAIRKSAWEKVRSEVCLKDSMVHEDIDLSIHLSRHGKIFFDDKLVVDSSFRRWTRIKPYLDYPYRALRTIQRHKLSLNKLTKSKKFVQNVLKKKLFKKKITKKKPATT